MDIFFAPLQGYTELAYRLAHAAVCGGVAGYGMPFLRLEHGELRRKDLRDIDPLKNSMPVLPQVIARDAAEFRFLTDTVVGMGYREVELNMGCPFPMQTNRGRGAGLLQRPDELSSILAEMRTYPDVRFSVKMRLGLASAEEWHSVLPILEDAPLSRITLHPRIGKQQYKGVVDMQEFDLFYHACQLPLVYNGDILTVDDIRCIEDRYPRLAGIMIGRGLLARPTLAEEYHSGVLLSDDEVRQRALEMARQAEAYYRRTLEGGEAQVRMKMRTFWEPLQPLMGKKFIKSLAVSK